MTTFMEDLRRRVEEKRAKQQAEAAERAVKQAAKVARPSPAERTAKLRGEVERWYATLAPEDRRSRYLISHLAPLFGCTVQQLGICLHSMTWRRKRAWRDDEPYHRYWLPPDSEEFGKKREKPPD